MAAGWGPDEGPDPLDGSSADVGDFPQGAQPDGAPDRARWAWTLIGVLAVGALAWQIAQGHRDTALFFVGLPALLASLLVANGPAKTPVGKMFASTTVGLLLTAMFLGEAALCVVFVAPLVWLVGFGVTMVVTTVAQRLHDRRAGHAFLLPILLVASLEGVTWGDPAEDVVVSRVVAASVAEVEALAAAGPDLSRLPAPTVLGVGFPLPAEAVGDGLDLGDRWTFAFARGQTVLEVVSRGEALVRFAPVTDTAPTTSWFAWREAELRWVDLGDGTSEVTMTLGFDRALAPGWWFGPIDRVLLGAAGEHLLDALDLEPVP